MEDLSKVNIFLFGLTYHIFLSKHFLKFFLISLNRKFLFINTTHLLSWLVIIFGSSFVCDKKPNKFRQGICQICSI